MAWELMKAGKDKALLLGWHNLITPFAVSSRNLSFSQIHNPSINNLDILKIDTLSNDSSTGM
jgi:hypothetical protein